MNSLNERADLMGKMLKTLSAKNGNHVHIPCQTALQTAKFLCQNCSEMDACQKWLEDHPNGAESAPEQCPNAVLFNKWTK